MGYWELSIGGSDMAADFLYILCKDIVKSSRKEIKRLNGEFNTDGIINVAMFYDEVVLKSKTLQKQEDIMLFAHKTLIPKLKKYIKEGKANGLDLYHLKHFNSILKKLIDYTEECE